MAKEWSRNVFVGRQERALVERLQKIGWRQTRKQRLCNKARNDTFGICVITHPQRHKGILALQNKSQRERYGM